MLTLSDISLRYARQLALDAVDLHLDQGEQLALIGSSGAGKSSLLSLLNTTLKPSSGRLTLLERQPWQLGRAALRQLRSDIGMVYQAAPLPPALKVADAVAAGRLGRWGTFKGLANLVWPLDLAGVEAALARVELADKLFARCGELSGGQLQRVGVARTLYQEAGLVLADEPVSALDPVLAKKTVSLLTDDCRARRATLVMSLHTVELALGHFDRVVGLRDGRILFDLPAAKVDPARLDELYRGTPPDLPSIPAKAESAPPARGRQC